MRPVHVWLLGLGVLALGVVIYVGRGKNRVDSVERVATSPPRVMERRRADLPRRAAKPSSVAAGVPSQPQTVPPRAIPATVTPLTGGVGPASVAEEVARVTIRAALEQAFQEHLPDQGLSDADYERLTDAVIRMRAVRQELNALPVSAENAETIRRLRAELDEALNEFQTVAGMDAVEFTRRVEPEAGLSDEEDDAADPDATPELLSDYPPPE